MAKQENPPLTVTKAPLHDPASQALIAELDAELKPRYPEQGATHFRLDADEVADGRGAFLVARIDGEAVACGAVRLIDRGTAEIKRMFVRPAARGRGVASAVLHALEREARVLGATRVVLETGERQHEALALYRRAGYAATAPYGEYIESPLSVCLARDLDDVAPTSEDVPPPLPDRLNEEVGVLTRREIEARIVGPLVEAFAERFGREATLEVLRQVVVAQAWQPWTFGLHDDQTTSNGNEVYSYVLSGTQKSTLGTWVPNFQWLVTDDIVNDPTRFPAGKGWVNHPPPWANDPQGGSGSAYSWSLASGANAGAVGVSVTVLEADIVGSGSGGSATPPTDLQTIVWNPPGNSSLNTPYNGAKDNAPGTPFVYYVGKGVTNNPGGSSIVKFLVVLEPQAPWYSLYVPNSGLQAGTVSAFGPHGSALTGFGQGLDKPVAVAFDASGNAYVTNYDSGTSTRSVVSFTPSGAANGAFSPAPGHLTYPQGVATDPAGNVYVANWGSTDAASTIVSFTPSGSLNTAFNPNGATPGVLSGTEAHLRGPEGIAIDGGGNLYVANFNDDTIVSFTSSGAANKVFSGATHVLSSTKLSKPQGIALDGAGNIYVASSGNATVVSFIATGTLNTNFAPTAATPGVLPVGATPYGVAVDPWYNVFVTLSSGAVQSVSARGNVNWGFGGTGSVTGLSTPYFPAVRPLAAPQ